MFTQIRMLLGMLHASPWRYYPLTLQYLSSTYAQLSVGKAFGCEELHLGARGFVGDQFLHLLSPSPTHSFTIHTCVLQECRHLRLMSYL